MSYLAPAAIPLPAVTPMTRSALIVDLIRASKQIVPAANATERAQIVTNWPEATGAPVSASNPVYVHRGDTNVVEWSTDGAAWSILRPQTDTGWANESYTESGWTIDQRFMIRNGYANLAIDRQRTGVTFGPADLTLRAAVGNGPSRTLFTWDLGNQHTGIPYMAQIGADGAVIGLNITVAQNYRLRGLLRWPVG